MNSTSPLQKLLFLCSNVSIILKNIFYLFQAWLTLLDTVTNGGTFWYFWASFSGMKLESLLPCSGWNMVVVLEFYLKIREQSLLCGPSIETYFIHSIIHSINHSFMYVVWSQEDNLVEEWYSRLKLACYKNHTLSPSPHSDCLHKFTVVYLCVW